MGGDPRGELVRHLSEEELDRLLDEADDPKVVKRLTFVKRLYKGATYEEAADDIGKSASTGSRWARRWNDGGLGQLTPNFGGGRPPKLGDEEQERLLELLREGQPWKAQEVHQLLDEEFDVEYHPDYLGRFLRNLGLSYAKPRPKRPSRPENADEILEERVADAFDEETETAHNKRPEDEDEGWVLDDDICTDGGTVVGFCGASHPQPYDNSHRLWYVDDPTLERPLVKLDEPAVGCYTLNGESVLTFPEDQSKENICALLEEVREQNPRSRILLVLDNFSSHICEHTRKRAHQLGTDLVFLPVGSPHLNPIEQVWKVLKRNASPIVVASESAFRTLARRLFNTLTDRPGFAKSWIDQFLRPYLQKLS
ncbi:IS630 family transposase [Halobiforma nitratireducens]|uniref:Transposase (ISH16) n=1 Tax=Halobiforma nitratireducens JCM 10879 TaxID=1227454 RepID=M0LTN6_9EURY|nr:IS630 family transposase [Halobiforma nitratireducens]EMA36811.1 transposase (ISH16) [Halobiforma nitratireducens JCM 10879]